MTYSFRGGTMSERIPHEVATLRWSCCDCVLGELDAKYSMWCLARYFRVDVPLMVKNVILVVSQVMMTLCENETER